MSNTLRQEVLRTFKALHQARKSVFQGDIRALTEGRKKINEEYRKQSHITDQDTIRELVNYAKAMEEELRTCVIQAREVEPGVYKAEIRDETTRLENVPFKEECCNNTSVKKNTKSCSEYSVS